jgi:hypothetical protein
MSRTLDVKTLDVYRVKYMRNSASKHKEANIDGLRYVEFAHAMVHTTVLPSSA